MITFNFENAPHSPDDLPVCLDYKLPRDSAEFSGEIKSRDAGEPHPSDTERPIACYCHCVSWKIRFNVEVLKARTVERQQLQFTALSPATCWAHGSTDMEKMGISSVSIGDASTDSLRGESTCDKGGTSPGSRIQSPS